MFGSGRKTCRMRSQAPGMVAHEQAHTSDRRAETGRAKRPFGNESFVSEMSRAIRAVLGTSLADERGS